MVLDLNLRASQQFSLPILGEGADIINAIWYTAEGNYLDAFLSSGAAVPIAGWAFTVFKRGRAVQKIFNRGGKIVVENLVNKADEAVEGAVKVGNDVVEEGLEQTTKSSGGLGRAGTGKDVDFENVIAGGLKKEGDAISHLGYYKPLRDQLSSLQRVIGADNLNRFTDYLRTLPPDVLKKLNADPSKVESFAKRVLEDADYAAAVRKGDLKLLDEANVGKGLLQIAKAKRIVGTSYNEIKPTQDWIYPSVVEKYKAKIIENTPIPPIIAYNTPKGIFIENGHHRFVAYLELGKQPNMVIKETSGPIGFPDWKNTKFETNNGASELWD